MLYWFQVGMGVFQLLGWLSMIWYVRRIEKQDAAQHDARLSAWAARAAEYELAIGSLTDSNLGPSEPQQQAERGGVYWTDGPGGGIISDEPLQLELRRMDGKVLVYLVINPHVLGGRVNGIGAW